MRPKVRLGVFVAVGLAVAVALAFVVAPEASSKPDGLEKVAIDEGFADGAEDHDLADSPTADYGVRGVDDARLSTGLAGALGIGVTFLVTGGLVLLVRRRARSSAASASASASAGPTVAPPA